MLKSIFAPNQNMQNCGNTFSRRFVFLTNVLRNVSGDYRIMINIEDDEVTCNSYVVFSQVKKDIHNFIYVDRHGNWVVGKLKKLL